MATSKNPLAFASGWRVVRDGSFVHVVPRNDSAEHSLSMACPCGPRFDVEVTTVIAHHAADGRHLYEDLDVM